jgi:hypothetical protein
MEAGAPLTLSLQEERGWPRGATADIRDEDVRGQEFVHVRHAGWHYHIHVRNRRVRTLSVVKVRVGTVDDHDGPAGRRLRLWIEWDRTQRGLLE